MEYYEDLKDLSIYYENDEDSIENLMQYFKQSLEKKFMEIFILTVIKFRHLFQVVFFFTVNILFSVEETRVEFTVGVTSYSSSWI